MIRIYCDSNIYRFIKPTHPTHKVELRETMESLRDKFIFCYSDAHLEDLKNSKKEFRDIDLELMGSYVKDNYFMYDHVYEKGFHSYLASPSEAFSGKNYEAASALLNDFNADNLFEDLGDSPAVEGVKSLFDTYMDMPIAALGATIDTSTIGDRPTFDKMFPGYDPSMSIKEFTGNVMGYGSKLLGEEKEVTELRKYIREYLDREEYSFDRWGMQFNERLKETGIGKTFLEMIDNMLLDNQKDDFYLKFSYVYTMLEMLNITEERKSGGGLKKFNYSSLNTDALHAYFGSYCDYFVSDDRGVLVKASIAYQLFNFPTKVLSAHDFTNLKITLTGQEETFNTFLGSVKHDLNNGLILSEKQGIATGKTIRTIRPAHAYFNYFNRMQLALEGNTSTVTFYCERSSHGNFYMFREIEIMVGKLIIAFGLDSETKGLYSFETENESESDEIRKWVFDQVTISLVRAYGAKSGSYLCLLLDFN